MKRLHIHKGRDLKRYGLNELISLFGVKAGNYYYEIARGVDNRAVQPNRIRKSIGAEETFERDIDDFDELKNQLLSIAQDVMRRCDKSESQGKTVTLKIKYNDFIVQTRSRTLDHFVSTTEELFAIAASLAEHPERPAKPIRLLGITMSNLNTDPDTRLEKRLTAYQLQLELQNKN